MKSAVDAFNEIYCSVIKNIDINILQKTISFDLTLVDGGKTTDHKLKFENCTAFLWVEKMAESNEFNDNYDISKWDYYELTSIDVYNTNLTSDDRWLKQFPLEYNVAIEIWSSALLIKTDKVILDGQQYLLT